VAVAESWLSRNHFLVRRLHSLTGIIPVGAFLIEHLLTNSLALRGPEAFNKQVQWIQEMPFLLALEVIFIFVPLAFHAIYGVAIALESKPNQNQYPYMDNWRYTLQRVTAWIAVVFILAHVLHFRFAYLFGGPVYSEAPGELKYYLLTWQGFRVVFPLGVWIAIYAIGTLAVIYHFCNGIATFCITWGITVGDKSRKRVLAGASVVGVILAIWAGMSLYAFAAKPLPPQAADTVAGFVMH
jgi:succinate dehydrogenase / fumarate reductase cytochrome b subunit